MQGNTKIFLLYSVCMDSSYLWQWWFFSLFSCSIFVCCFCWSSFFSFCCYGDCSFPFVFFCTLPLLLSSFSISFTFLSFNLLSFNLFSFNLFSLSLLSLNLFSFCLLSLTLLSFNLFSFYVFTLNLLPFSSRFNNYIRSTFSWNSIDKEKFLSI